MQTESDARRQLHGARASTVPPFPDDNRPMRNFHAHKPKVNDHFTSKGDTLSLRAMTLKEIARLSETKWLVYPEWLEGISWTRQS